MRISDSSSDVCSSDLFHGCDLMNCNLWKIRLTRVYLRPERVKFARRFRVEAANVGISVFQAMLSNFTEERQDLFFMQAAISFRRWTRYQIWHDLREAKKTTREIGRASCRERVCKYG